MIKRRHLVLAFALSLAMVFAGCKSTPKEEVEETPEVIETPVETEPSDYSEENAGLLEQLAAKRQAAIEAGAEKANPAAFKAAELEYEAAKAAAEDPAVSIAVAAKDLALRYEALEAYAKAKAKKDIIDENGFASYNQAAYDEATAILEELAAPEASLNFGASIRSKAQAAEQGYDAVLNAAYRSLAKAEREKAIEAKKNADSVKAAVSRKDDYDKAVALITKADSNFVTGGAYDAYLNYASSKELFTKLYVEISDARKQAQAALDAAKARVAASEAVAEKADEECPVEDGTEGIESEDAVLLEEDVFSNPEDAVVDIADLEGEETPAEEGDEE